MKDRRPNLFSSQRFTLFTGNNQNMPQNNQIYCYDDVRSPDPMTPTQKGEPREMFLQLIQKKDKQIRELKRKIRAYEAVITENKNKVQSSNYELQYFKLKIGEQLKKSKQLQSEVVKVNKRVVAMIKSLECVKKVKNPIQLRQDKVDWAELNQRIEQILKDQKLNPIVDLKLIQHLEKLVQKVANVIDSAFKLKKSKSSKELYPSPDKKVEEEKNFKEKIKVN